MKKLLFIISVLIVQSSFSQTHYTKLIDTVVAKIETNGYYHSADSTTTFFDKDSNVTGFISIEFRYADRNGKNLIKIDEMNKTATDSSSAWYYFKNQKLIKVEARVLINGKLHYQDFYFKDQKLIYSTPAEENFFDATSYLKKAKNYLKFKSKVYYPSYQI